VLLILGTVLPERESTVFSGVADNTSSIFYVITGLVVAWRRYRTWTDRDRAGWVLFGGPWAAGWLIFDWMNGAKLYPIIDGRPDTSVAPEIAGAGIGMYTIALAPSSWPTPLVKNTAHTPARALRNDPAPTE
jgi:hypothetical protein